MNEWRMVVVGRQTECKVVRSQPFRGGKTHGPSYTLDRTKTIGAVGQDHFPVTAEGQGGAQSTKQPQRIHVYKQH
jgi:hypothetical protein